MGLQPPLTVPLRSFLPPRPPIPLVHQMAPYQLPAVAQPPIPGLDAVPLKEPAVTHAPQPPSEPPIEAPTPIEEVLPPPPDLKPIIDRLALYVAKNGDTFEEGIRKKNDPRFDFLNDWSPFSPYYLQEKAQHRNKINSDKQQAEADHKSKQKVSFGLKMKVSGASKTSNSIFKNQPEEEEEGAEVAGKKDGFVPRVGKEDAKEKLRKQIEEKEKLLQRLKDQAMAGVKEKAKPMSAEKQALLKQKTELNQEKKLELQDERKKRAAEFIVKLKQTDESEGKKETATAAAGKDSTSSKVVLKRQPPKQPSDPTGLTLRKRAFKETSNSMKPKSEEPPTKDSKVSAFYEAVNRAFGK